MQPIFSFILVNFKSAAFLPEWFQSLRDAGLSHDLFEVIISNNDLSEKDALEILQLKYPFKLIHNSANIGFGAGCNRGAQSANGKILGFINPDVQFIPGNFLEIQDYFRDNEDVGAIGLKLITDNGKAQEWSAGVDVTLFDILKNNIGFKKSAGIWKSNIAIETDWVSGAALFMPRTIFSSINGFDEKFFLYFEDIDLCKRIRDAHKKIVYYPHLSVQHAGGKSSTSKHEQKKHYYLSQDLYFSKHRPKWEGVYIKLFRAMTHFR